MSTVTASAALSIEDVDYNSFHRLLSIRSGSGWLIDGYILSIFGVAVVQMSNVLTLNNFWQGLIGASALIGIFFGSFIAGTLTDIMGRKKLYFVGPTLFFVCSLAQLWIDSALGMFIARFMIGIGVGFEYPVASALLVEFLPKKNRGPQLAGLTILWFAGAALAYIVGEFILSLGNPEVTWRWVFASPAAIAAIIILIRLGTPESPRWLVKQERLPEAEGIIKRVYGDTFSLKNLPEQSVEKPVSVMDLLRSGYGARMLFTAIFWMCSVIPVFAVYAFAPKVMAALNLSGEYATWGNIAVTVLFVVGCAIATSIINTMGRRPLVIHSFLWSGLALLGLGAFSDASELVVLGLFGTYAIFIGGAQVLQLVYPNELFPTEVRTAAVGLGASISRIGAAIGVFLVPMALDGIGIGNTMFVAASVTLVGLLVSIILAPETKNMTLEAAASLKR